MTTSTPVQKKYSLQRSLEYYLLPDGKHHLEFKQWITTLQLDAQTNLELSSCCKNLENSGWLETQKRALLFQKIKTILETYVINTTRKTPYNNFIEYITNLNKHCYQGGYGHPIHYKYIINDTIQSNNPLETYSPHHWMISTTDYPLFATIPPIINLCASICGFYIRINENPEQAHWSS